MTTIASWSASHRVPGGRYARSRDAQTVYHIRTGRILSGRPPRSDALRYAVSADMDAIEAPPWDYADDDLRARAWAALQRLGDREREALTMYVDGYTLGEIGAAIGKSRERARQIVFRAIARLRGPLFGVVRHVEYGPVIVTWGRLWRRQRMVAA